MKKIWPYTLVVIAFILIIISMFKNPGNIYTNGTIIFGWILFLIQTFWVYSEKFYLKIKNIFYKIKNPECSWSLSIEINEVNFSYEQIFSKIEEIFTRVNPSQFKINELSDQRKLYSLGTFTIEVSIDSNNVNFDFNDFEVSYRRSSTIISDNILPMFEEIQRKLKPENIECFLDIKFYGDNPYYGMYTKKIEIEKIEVFKMKFKAEEQTVTITKDAISVYVTSFNKLRTLSEKYLNLSPK